MPRPRQRSRAEILLAKEIDGLKTRICLLLRQVEDKDGIVGRLEMLLRERLTKIDTLTAQVDRLREVNKRLDAEAEQLARLVCLSPDAPIFPATEA
jgi:hypothetical protein